MVLKYSEHSENPGKSGVGKDVSKACTEVVFLNNTKSTLNIAKTLEWESNYPTFKKFGQVEMKN